MKQKKMEESRPTPLVTAPRHPPLPGGELVRQDPHAFLFLLNVITALVWHQTFPIFGGLDYLIGLVVGFVAIWFTNRTYGRRIYDLFYFIGFVLWEVLLSNFTQAKLTLHPKPKLNPGIVAVPLTVSTGLEIMLLAGVIAMTPGTIAIDLGRNARHERVLYIHNISLDDPEEFRWSVKNTFERLLLRVTRGREE
ncbi:MAG: Na+/H+ antiporter subunit E [Caldilineaceae bacterium]|nr:Na+/H+ antiporter subunit E [Caldilineaceae bacterium]